MSEKVVWEKDVRKYGKLRIDESIDEALISLELLKQGKLRNSASKAFMAFKAFLSGLVSINNSTFSSLLDEKERKFFYKIGFTAPSNRLILYSTLLEKDFPGITNLAKEALSLHVFSYLGYDKAGEYSPITSKDDAKKWIIDFITNLAKLIIKVEEKGKEILKEVEELKK
ncbi:conserved hypothetical protein [Acidianus hospitalis W1]|jgi:hypothetical protein|uniref:Uncharacterized protein n=1 Tax=Acidianus hospitalis (strain W1) TaxID=933801 RepID=F4B7U6_ACIHW|nr:PaREP1 family protein [Acidianus hospitalis]AEE94843.1 conserved hypothetical protein [Acidianus hospitalis W1]MDT7901491.1 PaREP1 family protein [Acidianus sp.]